MCTGQYRVRFINARLINPGDDYDHFYALLHTFAAFARFVLRRAGVPGGDGRSRNDRNDQNDQFEDQE